MDEKSLNHGQSRKILPAMTRHVKQEVLFRLKSVLGHVEGVIRMLEREEYCIDVIKQVAAIEVALKKVGAILLQNHLDSCVAVAIKEKSPAVRSRVVRELLEIFQENKRGSQPVHISSTNRNRKSKGKNNGKRSSLRHAG